MKMTALSIKRLNILLAEQYQNIILLVKLFQSNASFIQPFHYNKDNFYLWDFVPMKHFNSLKYTEIMEKSTSMIGTLQRVKHIYPRLVCQALSTQKSFPSSNTFIMNTFEMSSHVVIITKVKAVSKKSEVKIEIVNPNFRNVHLH